MTSHRKSLSEKELNQVIALAWCDKTTFEMIYDQTGLSHDEVKKIMKTYLKPGSYKKWRERVKTISNKHTYKPRFRTRQELEEC